MQQLPINSRVYVNLNPLDPYESKVTGTIVKVEHVAGEIYYQVRLDPPLLGIRGFVSEMSYHSRLVSLLKSPSST